MDYAKIYQTDYSKSLPLPESKFEPPEGFEETLQSVIQEFELDLKKMMGKS